MKTNRMDHPAFLFQQNNNAMRRKNAYPPAFAGYHETWMENSPNVHYTESILPADTRNVKQKCTNLSFFQIHIPPKTPISPLPQYIFQLSAWSAKRFAAPKHAGI
ncbi:MAG: hypothetical protein J6J51_01925 [Clostridia bacterium]|nr:hypothetical protein [Clostridia bacterium]